MDTNVVLTHGYGWLSGGGWLGWGMGGDEWLIGVGGWLNCGWEAKWEVSG
jgi:hypothetical protein